MKKVLTNGMFCTIISKLSRNAAIAQPVERILGKDEVASSNLASSSKTPDSLRESRLFLVSRLMISASIRVAKAAANGVFPDAVGPRMVIRLYFFIQVVFLSGNKSNTKMDKHKKIKEKRLQKFSAAFNSL